MARPISIKTGQRFGRLVAVAHHSRKADGSALWSFKCDCGTLTIKLVYSVKRGATRSCGCLNKEIAPARNRAIFTTHNMSRTSEYGIWKAMRRRCADLSNQDYGGRGIRVCRRWSKFEHFFADMGHRPTPRHTLERENNNGHYTPTNCIWAVQSIQGRNTRRAKYVRVAGREYRLSDLTERAYYKIKRPILNASKQACG